MIDDVIVLEKMININYVSAVEKEYLYEDAKFLIQELSQYIEEGYINVIRLEFY